VDEAMVIDPAQGQQPQAAVEAAPEAAPEVAPEGENPPEEIGCLPSVCPYFSCIILVSSQIAGMIIAHFVPGRAGEAAIEAIDQAAQVAAIAAHAIADNQADQSFYARRANLDHAQRHPNIEGWAHYITEKADTAINLANVATQLFATGRIPIGAVITAIHAFQTARIITGIYPPSVAEVTLVHAIGNYNGPTRGDHPPTFLVAGTANQFFDWLSDGLIRGIIVYPIIDRLEWGMDRIYGINEPDDHPVYMERVPMHPYDEPQEAAAGAGPAVPDNPYRDTMQIMAWIFLGTAYTYDSPFEY